MEEGLSYMKNAIGKICVFCGSSDSVDNAYLDAAWALGEAVAERGLDLIFGGGGTGLMGSLADAALAGGGQVIGILPRIFDTPALAHPNLSELRIVDDMHNRKAMMMEAADAFLALPGGFGTFEELFEVLTWAQIGIHRKPVGVLNVNGYFDPLIDLIEHSRDEGFILEEHPDLLIIDDDVDRLLSRLTQYQPPEGLERWVDREEERG
jgi:uncharacterized protein (TIGR00730 family)